MKQESSSRPAFRTGLMVLSLAAGAALILNFTAMASENSTPDPAKTAPYKETIEKLTISTS